MNWIDKIKKRIAQITPGDWSTAAGRYDEHIVCYNDDAMNTLAYCRSNADAEFIAHSKADVQQLIEIAELGRKLISSANINNGDGVQMGLVLDEKTWDLFVSKIKMEEIDE